MRSLLAASLPRVHQVFSGATTWAQFVSLSRLRIKLILREIPFWAIVVLMIAFAVNNGYFAGRVGETDVWPVTYLMLQAVEGSAMLFLFIVARLYAAELIWRERDIHFEGIQDALPMRESVMSETLAEYSALMVMKKKYGADQMHRFLRHELDRYLRGRSSEVRHEPPLALVQREPYVWYQKGGQIMYALADYIGEDKVNLALHNFLMQYRYANASNPKTEPYPDTRQLVAALRAQTPPELQYLIDDGFESIVLYDNKATSATVTALADHKYKVTLQVQARKVKSDGNGNESPLTLNDYIDIGVFKGGKDEEQPLYLKREKLTKEQNTFEIVVSEEPTRAGIDPYNKLVDRIADDNLIDVTQR